MIDMDTVVIASERRLSSDLGGETVVLDTDAGEYWSLNPVSARIWGLIREPLPIHGIVSTLVGEYDVSPTLCELEVKNILMKMEKAGLVEFRGLRGSNP